MGNVTSFVMFPEHHEKLGQLAQQLGVNRSVVMRKLIEQAEIISLPEMKVKPLVNKNNRNAIAFQGQGEAVVQA